MRPSHVLVPALLLALGVADVPSAEARGRAALGAPVPPAAACDARARSLAAVERIAEWFQRLPGPGAQQAGGVLERLARVFAQRHADDCVAVNQVQVVGTHNSYHVEPVPELIDIFVSFDPAAIAWEYTHRPLPEQFAQLGVRQIELDVFADPQGGLYAEPLGLQLLTGGPTRIPELEPPGIKVLHVQDLDWDTTCATLVACLTQLKAWSDRHPTHLPVAVLVEAKDDRIEVGLPIDFAVPVPWDDEQLRTLDATIRSVFPPERILTPADVRGDATTLEEAVLGGGWPRLGQARGRVLFALDNGGAIRDRYRSGRPALEDRVLFTNSPPGEPDAAFIKLNQPLGNEALIRDLVAAGYIVRTRADADTFEARDDDPTRRDTALRSGAQWISTDYPEPDPGFSDYRVVLPGREPGDPGRCNPVNAPMGCRDAALEP